MWHRSNLFCRVVPADDCRRSGRPGHTVQPLDSIQWLCLEPISDESRMPGGWGMQMQFRVVFVGTGNTCCSLMAARILPDHLHMTGLVSRARCRRGVPISLRRGALMDLRAVRALTGRASTLIASITSRQRKRGMSIPTFSSPSISHAD
uniref:Uncharacterized protein n=1 Tax=Rhodococcus sp. NS1 TaxID=402236 RepID=A0A097SQN0_9NOCA|nr:hypothetical protein LRS1606.407 [Rhodococcus sp. NS1]